MPLPLDIGELLAAVQGLGRDYWKGLIGLSKILLEGYLLIYEI
jgi:hypothetical protein